MRYSHYKPTGIAWLPEVPEEWECCKLKFLCTMHAGKNISAEEIEVCGEYSVYGGNGRRGYFGEFNEDGEFLLVGRQGALCGNVHYVHEKFWATEHALVTSINGDSDVRFMFYLMSAMNLNQYASQTAAQPGLAASTILDVKTIKPPLPTQRAIVTFLDEKCGKVDRLVAAKEKEVALLKELKQSMIAEAVTRGVSATADAENAKGAKTRKDSLRSSANSAFFASAPAGNPSRRLVPSGIPWLPEVPEGWEARKMKYLFTERSDKGHPEEPPLCSTQAYGVIPQSLYENRVVVVNKDGLGQLKLVKVGDFVISLRSFQGGIEIAHYQGIISAAYTILAPRDSRNSPYFRYLFKSHAFIQLLQTCVTGIREGQNINYPLLSRKFIPVPPLDEQREIVAHIEARAAKIDAAVLGLEREIAALKEYKQRLIADVVTGQRKVA